MSDDEEAVAKPLGEVVDFKILREDWSNYRLADGTILKARLVVTKVIRTDQHDPTTGEPMYVFSRATALSTISGKELRGPPSSMPSPQEMQASITGLVDFESADKAEKWNVYSLSDGSELRVKLEVTKISKTSLFDDMGDPVYFVVSENIVRVWSPPNLFVKPSKAEGKVTPDIYK
jgi:hypothetical protein